MRFSTSLHPISCTRDITRAKLQLCVLKALANDMLKCRCTHWNHTTFLRRENKQQTLNMQRLRNCNISAQSYPLRSGAGELLTPDYRPRGLLSICPDKLPAPIFFFNAVVIYQVVSKMLVRGEKNKQKHTHTLTHKNPHHCTLNYFIIISYHYYECYVTSKERNSRN